MVYFPNRYSKSYRACLADLKIKFKTEVLNGLTSENQSNSSSADGQRKDSSAETANNTL